MRLPIMRKQSASVLSLPDLAGGLNLRDGISEVLDNQMTDCKNMFWSDGLLRTRPCMYENEQVAIDGGNGNGVIERLRLHNCFKIYGGEKVQLCSLGTTVNTTIGSSSSTAEDNQITDNDIYVGEFVQYNISFLWLGNTGLQKFSEIIIENEADIPDSYFVCQYQDMLYCFMNSGVIYKISIKSDTSWSIVTESELYTPLVATSCRKIPSANASTKQAAESGIMIEGFNILSDYYTMNFNSYNPDIVTAENQSHEMRYHIIESVAKSKYNGKKVTAVYKGVTHTVTLDGSSDTIMESKVQDDGLKMGVRRNRVSFFDKDNKVVTVSEGNENDLVITAPYITSAAEKQKVFGMTRCEWFGGGTSGLSGGTRLFLCGNEKHSDLVLWSGLNKPLYFSENSYFYVGNGAGAVTGFGKQSDKLIIFKETETWSTEYAQNTNIDAQSLISGNVVDYASSAVYFPLTQINPNIGCGFPDTVQLCRNRLVWLGSDNKVYTLVSESPYTERSIYCVSEMVDRRIRKISSCYNISRASACDWDGYYCLLLDKILLLMDYNCYGYTHIAGHSKTEDANVKIPWYLWELPQGDAVANVGGALISAACDFRANSSYARSFSFKNGSVDIFLNNNGEIYESPIVSSFATKVFDFGAPYVKKNIEQINLQLGNNGGKRVKVLFVTENGTEQTDVIPSGTETDNYAAGYIESCAVFPCIKQVLKFGIKLECDRTLAVDSIILKYRPCGDAR